MARSRMKLYWCETEDHDEDWFIVARSAAAARRSHEDQEGYDRGDAWCSLVCALPDDRQDEREGWPSDELLKACGGKLQPMPASPGAKMMGSGNRAVSFNGRVYVDRHNYANTVAALGKGSN